MSNGTLNGLGTKQIIGGNAMSTSEGFLGRKLAEPVGQPIFFGQGHHVPYANRTLRRFPGAATMDAGASKERRSAPLRLQS
jgi:hypothetical protein